MTEDVIARYILDLKDLKGKVSELEKQFGKVDGAAEKSAKKVSSSFDNAATTAKKSLTGIAESIVAAFAIREVINFGKESIAAFAKAEEQVNKLKFAIKNVSGEGADAFENLINQAKKLASITAFDDEDIAQVQAIQIQFGLTSAQVEKLTPSILDLSVATGQDLVSATNVALSAISGQTRGLKEVGAQFKDTGSATENYNTLLEKLNKLQGVANEELNTTSGRLKALNIQYENLQEQVGEKLSPAFLKFKITIADIQNDIADFFFGLDAASKKKSDVKNVADIVLADTKATVSSLNKELSVASSTLEALKNRVAEISKNSKTEKLSFIDQKETDALTKKIKEQELQVSALTEAIVRKSAAEKQASEQAIHNADVQKLAAENLLVLTKDQITQEIAVLSVRKDANTKDIQDQIERRQNAIDKIIELEKKAQSDREKAAFDAAQKLKEITDKANQDALISVSETESQKLQIQKQAAIDQVNALSSQVGGTKGEELRLQALLALNKLYDGLITSALSDELEKRKQLEEKYLQDQYDQLISNIDRSKDIKIQKAIEEFNEIGDFTEEAQKRLAKRIENIELGILRSKINNTKEGTNERLQLEIEYQEKVKALGIKANEDANKDAQIQLENRRAIRDQAIQTAQSIADSIFEINRNANDAQIAEIERVKEAEFKALDDTLAANQRNFDDRLIGAKEFRDTEKKLQAQKQAADDAARKKENEIRRKQDAADKEQKLFSIILSTATGIMNIWSQFGAYPPVAAALTALLAGIAAAQTAAVLSAPVPKYYKGTRYVDEQGVYPSGIDTVDAKLTKGERVITVDDNKKNWHLYEAIRTKQFDKYINKVYVVPALSKAIETGKIREQKSFAENVAYSLMMNEDSLAKKIAFEMAKEADWRTRKGQKVIGMDQLIDTIKQTTKPQYRKN